METESGIKTVDEAVAGDAVVGIFKHAQHDGGGVENSCQLKITEIRIDIGREILQRWHVDPIPNSEDRAHDRHVAAVQRSICPYHEVAKEGQLRVQRHNLEACPARLILHGNLIDCGKARPPDGAEQLALDRKAIWIEKAYT